MEKKIYDGAARISVTLAGGVTVSVEVEEYASATDYISAFVQIMELLTFQGEAIQKSLEEVAKDYDED